jgi:RNA 3'-terminal phosphate cyclase (ATP)
MLTIDGSSGEGGGQILRTSLALSLVTGKPIRVVNIRAGRDKPGLMRQHLVAVQAAAQIGAARVTGAELGSKALTFDPGAVSPGTYTFSVGTAGSTTLVLATVLPALLLSEGGSSLTLEGGTHNPHAPPFDFLAKALLPLLARLGADVTATLERPGFYPAGGGRFTVRIEPAKEWRPLELLERGEIKNRRVTATVAGLPSAIAERELEAVREILGWDRDVCGKAVVKNAHGPGNVLTAVLESEHVTEVFTGFGEKGVSAERVAEQVAGEVQRYLDAGVPVSEHLADQLLLPLALARGGSFRTLPLSRHATTQIALLMQILGLEVKTEKVSDLVCEVHVAR